MGAEKYFRQNGLAIAQEPTTADAVVINGSGAMCPMYHGLGVLERYIKEGYRKIIVLPSSFYAPQGRFAELKYLAKARDCDLIFFARERASFDRLSRAFAPNRDVFLAHDMALYLDADDLAATIRAFRRRTPYTLIVERRDQEAATNIARNKAYAIPLKRNIPTWLKRPVKRTLMRNRNKSDLRKACEIHMRGGAVPVNDVVYADISDKSLYSFHDFVNLAFHASQVYTTRLHVAILREILGLPCYLIPTGGEYRKNESVFEHSLAGNGRVKLFPLDAGTSHSGVSESHV